MGAWSDLGPLRCTQERLGLASGGALKPSEERLVSSRSIGSQAPSSREPGDDAAWPVRTALEPKRFYAMIAVLIAVEVLSSLATGMVFTALPAIAADLGDVELAGWLITSFFLVQAGAAAIGGRLGDMFGRTRILNVVVIVSVLGAVVSAIPADPGVTICGRALQGISGAILPLCYGLVQRYAQPRRAPFWIGCITGAYAFAGALGYIVAGYLADRGDWRDIFWFMAGYGALLVPAILLVLPKDEPSKARAKLDLVGGFLFVPALAAVLYGVGIGGKLGWLDMAPWLWVVGGAALLAAWAWYEARHEDPLIDVRLLARPAVAIGNLSGALAGLGMMQLPLVIMLLFQQPTWTGVGLGVAAMTAGILKLPSNGATLIAAPLSGFISTVVGSRISVLVGGLTGVGAWIYLLFCHATLTQAIIGSILAASANAILLAALPNLILEQSPIERSSEATGLSIVSRTVFTAIGAQIVAMLLARDVISRNGSTSFPSEAAYQGVFIFAAVTAALAAMIACLPSRAAVD